MNKSLKKVRTDLEASELVDKLGRISFTVMLHPSPARSEGNQAKYSTSDSQKSS